MPARNDSEPLEYGSEFAHAKGEDALMNYIRGAINRGVTEWNLTTPQVIGVLELMKLRLWSDFDEVPVGTREET